MSSPSQREGEDKGRCFPLISCPSLRRELTVCFLSLFEEGAYRLFSVLKALIACFLFLSEGGTSRLFPALLISRTVIRAVSNYIFYYWARSSAAERLICNEEVVGSIPTESTLFII